MNGWMDGCHFIFFLRSLTDQIMLLCNTQTTIYFIFFRHSFLEQVFSLTWLNWQRSISQLTRWWFTLWYNNKQSHQLQGGDPENHSFAQCSEVLINVRFTKRWRAATILSVPCQQVKQHEYVVLPTMHPDCESLQFLPGKEGDQTDTAQQRQVLSSLCVVAEQRLNWSSPWWNVMEVFCSSVLPKFWFCPDILSPFSTQIYCLPLLLVLVSDNLNASQRVCAFQIFAVAADVRSASKRCTQSMFAHLIFVCAERPSETNTHRHASCGEHGCWHSHMEGGGMHGKGSSERLSSLLPLPTPK